MTTTHSATSKAGPKPPSLKHYREVRKTYPHLTPGTYGLGLFLAEPVDPVLEAEFLRRLNDPACKLESLKMTCGGAELQMRELVNQGNPETQAKTSQLMQAFILRMQKIAEGAQ